MNYFLIAIAALLLFAKKKTTSSYDVTIDFSNSVPLSRVTIIDSNNVATIFDKANGDVQTKSIATPNATIQFLQLEADPGAVTYLQISDTLNIGTGESANVSPLNNIYYVFTNMR